MNNDDLRIAFIGNREHSKYVLQHLLLRGWNITCAIGASETMASQQAGYDSMSGLCERFNVPLIETNDINDENIIKKINRRNPHVGICCGWTQIITKDVRTIPDQGLLGFHFSPLPEGRGGAPINWQIIRGENEVGVSCFRLVEEIDHGGLFAQSSVPIEDRDDVSTIYNKVSMATCDILDEILPQIADGTIEVTKQTFENATYYPQRKPADGLIEWNQDTQKLHNWVRAQTHPYPGAFTFYDGQKMTIWEGEIADKSTDTLPGTILNVEPEGGMDVATANGVYRLTRVEFERYPPMWADVLADRLNISPGDRLGSPDQFPDWLYTGIRDRSGGINYSTNLERGEEGEVQAVCCCHRTERNLKIVAQLGDTLLIEEEFEVDGWTSKSIPFGASHKGSELLVIEFFENSERIDIRRLNIYTS